MKTMRNVGLVALLTLIGLSVGSCSGGSGRGAKKTGKLDPNTCPVELTRPTVSPISSSVMGQSIFTVDVKNVSQVDIDTVKAMAVIFDANGQRLGEPEEVNISPGFGVDIAPGDEGEFKFTTGMKDAVRAVLVVKEVIYVMVPEGKGMELFKMDIKWTNPKFDAEFAAAK